MEKTGIYIHIPFCQSKCLYCDFASWSGYNESMIDQYFEALQREIYIFSKKNPQCEVGTVYFGGGTPSYVNSQLIEKIMVWIKDCFGCDYKNEVFERTIEMNPASLTQEKAEKYKEMGFNRVSIGLQSTQDHLLRRLGRPHNFKAFMSTYTALTQAGITNISADLMFGLPEQKLKDVIESVKILAQLKNVRHISCYSLKVEEGTPFFKMKEEDKLNLPDEKTERIMQRVILKELLKEGFTQYEISNFSRAGFESKHNTLYWEMKPYVGFGLGAASYYKGKRWTNTFDMKEYTGKWIKGYAPVDEEHVLNIDEQKGDFMFLGLRKTKGVFDRDYHSYFNSSFFEDYREVLENLKKQGLIGADKDRIYLTQKGQDFANQVFMAFV